MSNMRHIPRKPRSIEEKGSLKTHLTDNGVDYNLFVRLDDSGIDNSAIGKVLGKTRHTIRRWREIRRHEVKHE